MRVKHIVRDVVRSGLGRICAFAVAVPAVGIMVTSPAFAAGHVGSQTCPVGGPSTFNRAICDGYFTGQDQYNNGIDVANVLANPGGNDALMAVTNVDQFIAEIKNALNGSDATEQKGTAFLIETMLGKNGSQFTSITGGVSQAQSDVSYWEKLVRKYDAEGRVDWNPSNHLTTMTSFINSGVSTKENLDPVFFMDGPKDRPLITFTNPDGSKYDIDKNCANPTGLVDPLFGWTLEPLQPKVSVGNFVWFDANNDGVVNGKDDGQGFNNVSMNLYEKTADTNNDGVLSASELAAATALKTTKTANDARSGLPTSGRAGYYEFTNLDPGDYFVCVAPSNFGTSGLLSRYSASPVPSGVTGNSRSDNQSHGLVPDGGTMVANGLCSSQTTLNVFTEPATTTSPADDDNDDSSDQTIDFGFWHPYSLGNRVWLDKDNSGDINGADGDHPGIGNVVVALYDCDGTRITTTTTDSDGHYRFDNLNEGCYQTEVVTSNFTDNPTLSTCGMSSTGSKQSANPENNIDSDDNGIDPPKAGTAVRTGSLNLGPFAVEPTGETDLAVSDQGTADDFANMTLDFGFTCRLASTGQSMFGIISTATILMVGGGILLAKMEYRAKQNV